MALLRQPSDARASSHVSRGLLVSLLLLALGLAACTTPPTRQQDAAEPSPPSEPPRAAASPAPGPSPGTSPRPTPNGTAKDHPPVDAGALVERFVVEVLGGEVRPPRTDIEVPVGDTIELAVTSDVAATLRAVDLDVTRDLSANRETVVPITVKRPGTFEVTLDGTLLAVITATP